MNARAFIESSPPFWHDAGMRAWTLLALLSATCVFACAQEIRILLPERTRLLDRQRVDLVVEVRGTAKPEGFRVTAGGRDITGRFEGPAAAALDCEARPAAVYRANLYEFSAGTVELAAAITANGKQARDARTIRVFPFAPKGRPRNIILFIGDAMGNAYRDAARIVARSVETRPGIPGLREGYFDRLLEMDQMPVTGLMMHYGRETLVTDSAATATAWSTGNKPFSGMLSALPDGTDCAWRRNATQQTFAAMADNPRIESLWEYLKRLHRYRTGVVSTAYITDATPAAQGAHTPHRGASFEIARQYLENPMQGGKPAFDVILGGGKEDFESGIRSDRRDLIAEFQRLGYRYVETAAQVQALPASQRLLLGLFRRPNVVATAPGGLSATANGNFDAAYDRLRLTRPGSEPLADLGVWTDQPFLDGLTRTAIQALSGPNSSEPFALQVEGGLVDKQSHPNHAAGTIWDAIELDKAVGVARAWAKARTTPDTLIVVTGDHDQSMSLLGAVELADSDLSSREPVAKLPSGAAIYPDALVNLRSGVGIGQVPAELMKKARQAGGGLPDYQDANSDGYPENREVSGKGRRRLAVGFRTGGHTGTALPLTAEGPGAALFLGYLDQSDVPFKIAAALSGNTTKLDQLLSDAAKAIEPTRSSGVPVSGSK